MEDPDFDEFFDGLSSEETEEIIQFLVDQNAAEWTGMDEYGERMFKFNMDVLQKVMPGLHSQIMADIDNTMLDLFQKGLVEVEYDENLEAMFHLSDQAREILHEMGMDYLEDE